jgi:hypothetical protein
LQDFDRLRRKVNQVRVPEIELRPSRLREFIAALPGQQKRLEERAEGPSDFVACYPEQANFIVIEISIAGPIVLLAWIRS